MNHYIKRIAYYIIGKKFSLMNKHVKIEHGARVNFKSEFEGYNKICENTYFSGHIGLCSYIGPDSLVVGKIGRFCSIARNVHFLESTHPTEGFISSHPAFYSIGKQCGISFVNEQKFNEKPKVEGEKYPIVVGNDVYIGAGATIVAPVTIGDGAIIAANATVTKDVEPFSIVGGTPARKIRMRFDDSEIEYINNSRWWEHELEWFMKHGECFVNIDQFKLMIEESTYECE